MATETIKTPSRTSGRRPGRSGPACPWAGSRKRSPSTRARCDRQLPYIPEAARPEKLIQVPDWVVQNMDRGRRRANQLHRFRDCQRRRRQWLSFEETTDWCAREPGTLRRDETLRAQAYEDLRDAMLVGDFGRGPRSRVLYFHPDGAELRLRLTPEGLRTWLDFYGTHNPLITDEILSRCWFPRDLCQAWFARQGLTWPPAFDPSNVQIGPVVSERPPSAPSIIISGEIAIAMPDAAGSFCDRPVPNFVIGAAHTVFEWCMVYKDRHPGAIHPDHNGATVRDMETRLTLLGTTGGARNDPEWHALNEVYRERESDIERDRTIPLKRAYCDDAPDVFDATRCLLEIGPVLARARRRTDFGQTMAELLALHDRLAGDQVAAATTISLRAAPDPAIHKAITAAYDNAETASAKPPNLREIIEPVQAILREQGHKASGSRIQELADAPQHQGRRRRPWAKTVASEVAPK